MGSVANLSTPKNGEILIAATQVCAPYRPFVWALLVAGWWLWGRRGRGVISMMLSVLHKV
jgi:hypothetical protein